MFIWRGEVSATTAAPAAAGQARAVSRYAITELHRAAFDGDTAKFAGLQHLVNARDGNGDRPLHYAVMGGKPDAVRALVALGAKVDATNKQCRTPLHLNFIRGKGPKATPDGKKEYVKNVAEGIPDADRMTIGGILHRRNAEIDVWDGDGRTALYYAVKNRMADAVTELINAGADPDISCNYGGEHILEAAVENGDAEVLRRLLDTGINPNGNEQRRLHLLWIAVTKENEECVELLLRAGALPLHVTRGSDRLIEYNGRSEKIRHMIDEAVEKYTAPEARRGDGPRGGRIRGPGQGSERAGGQ